VPGVYPGVSFDTYAIWPAANHSVLRHFDKTPAHAYYKWTHQQESTEFQGLGHLIHEAVLEPALFRSRGPVVAPKVDRRTTVGKETWAAFEKQHAGRTIITANQMEALRGIQQSISGHASAREALYGFGTNELSIIWIDPETGVLCKGRIDRFCEIGTQPVILDLKSISRAASTHQAERSVNEYGYHQQAAFYLRGLDTLVPPEPGVTRQFVWLFCETEPPYCVRLFQAEDAALDLGRREMDSYLAAYAHCAEVKEWPGWPEGVDLLGLPASVYKRFDLE
jgi:hypothetical protein